MKEDQLFDLLDGIASAEVLRQHEALMKSSADYALNFREMQAFHGMMNGLPLEKTSDAFTEKLVAQLTPQPVVYQSSFKLPIYFLIFSGIILLLIALLLLPIEATNSPKTTWQINMNWVTNPLTTQICMIISVLSVLVLIDKAILKPYFSRFLSH